MSCFAIAYSPPLFSPAQNHRYFLAGMSVVRTEDGFVSQRLIQYQAPSAPQKLREEIVNLQLFRILYFFSNQFQSSA